MSSCSLMRRGCCASVLVLLAACAEMESPTAVDEALLRHAANASAIADNPAVHLLPPLAPAAHYSGVFDASLSPEFLIYAGTQTNCDVDASAGCAPLVAHLTADGRGAERVRLDAEAEHYAAVWKPNSQPSGVHRLVVRVGAQTIETFDVTFAKKGAQPIHVRIEEGALRLAATEVGAAGGSVTAAGGDVTLGIPVDALSEATTITVEQLDAGTGDERVVGSVYEFGPDGTQFDAPVEIRIAFDPATVPSGVSPRMLRLHTLVNGEWQLVPGSTVDTENNIVSGSTTHFSTYAVLPDAFVVVSSGEWHACGLTSGGSAWCWGSNFSNQLGAPTTETCAASAGPGTSCATTAVEVLGGLTFQSIEAGNVHTCGVTVTGEAWCWGGNARGELGDGTTTSSAVPVRAAPTLAFSSISADFRQTCGVTTSGDVYCWGANHNGQLGSATTETCVGLPCSTAPVRVAIPAASLVDVGLGHACALTSANDVYCWGWNVFGQVGTGGISASAPPTLIPGGTYAAVSAGAIHNCVTTAGGAASCFGGDLIRTGALGNGTFGRRLTPTPVAGGHSFAQIDASNGNYIFTHTCGVTTIGAAWCWGANNDGQLGVSTAPEICTSGGTSYDCTSSPIAVSGGHSFSFVTAGVGFTCGFTTAGDVYCWGRNDSGQLGNGSTVWSRSPVLVATAP